MTRFAFARQFFFSDLGQGFTIVQAYYRGRQRYAFNMTVNVRLSREFSIGGTRLALGLDAFNLLNSDALGRRGLEKRPDAPRTSPLSNPPAPSL